MKIWSPDNLGKWDYSGMGTYTLGFTRSWEYGAHRALDKWSPGNVELYLGDMEMYNHWNPGNIGLW